MTPKELSDNLKKKLPHKSPKDKSFHENLRAEFDDYLNSLRELKESEFNQICNNNIALSKFIKIETELCKKIIKIINDVRNGNPITAYNQLTKILSDSRFQPTKMYEHIESIASVAPIDKTFYRIRKHKPSKISDPDDIVKHCPFEKVHRLGNFRFSLPGFPCLYLGASEEVAKREVGNRKKQQYYCGKYKIKTDESLNLLNLAPYANNGCIKDSFTFLSLYPFYLSCLTKKANNTKAHFHEEYIVPQLFLLYVRNRQTPKIDGIRYLSTLYKKGDDISRMINYVFPVTQIQNKGFDEKLMNKFVLTMQDVKV